MLPDPPVPIAAVHLQFQNRVEVTFDQQLQPGPVTPDNWNWRWLNFRKLGVAPATVAGNVVTIMEVNQFGDVGPDVVSYDATVPDIVNLWGTPAAPFVDFPLV